MPLILISNSAYERPLAVTPFGTPEVVPDWKETHAMQALLGDRCLGQWIRTDLGVRTFQGVGRNGPTREQVVRRITKDLHTRDISEDLLCDSQSQVPLHRRCLPECGYHVPFEGYTDQIRVSLVSSFSLFFGPCAGSPAFPFSLGRGGGVRLLFKILIHVSGHFNPQYFRIKNTVNHATVCCGC